MLGEAAIMVFPDFDPVALQLGPFAIRWYALSYIAGIALGWFLCVRLIRLSPALVTRAQLDDFTTWLIVGIILGGRLGQVILWEPLYYLRNPLEVLAIWRGGMSFHGGLVGVILAIILFARARKLPPLALSDLVGVAAPIGLLLGRVANYINGELWGRPTDGSWGVIFRHVDDLPRHPSQLYEAALEGALLLAVMGLAARSSSWRDRPGRLTGLFLVGYALARGFSEFFREKEVDLGAIGFITWGQALSLPMAAYGLYLILRATAPNKAIATEQ